MPHLWTTRIWQDMLQLFYPSVCLACQMPLTDSEELICIACRLQLPETNQHHPHAPQTALKRFAGQVPVEFVYSFMYFTKKGAVQRLIHSLKYRGEKEVGQVLGRWYGYQLRQERSLHDNIDLIVGVPLHPSKLRQRGYNQSDSFAKGLSEALQIPWADDVLIRNKHTVSQTGKDRMARWENVDQVFGVPKPEVVRNQRILLVDDVLTTGATLGVCAAALLDAGCQSVGIVTIAAAR